MEQSFQKLRTERYEAYTTHIRALPHYEASQSRQERLLLDAESLKRLNADIRRAGAVLQDNVNADWQQCCLEYPAALDRSFRLIDIRFPGHPGKPF